MATDVRNDTAQDYTILRIKRKRNEEPLDALVVDPESRGRRKKTKGPVSVFKFAETVEQSAWDDERQKKDLEERIATLARAKKEAQISEASSTTVPAPPAVPPTQRAPLAPLVPTPVRQQTDDLARKYTVVQNEPSEYRRRRYPTAPPKVVSVKDLEKPKVTVYDAVPSAPSVTPASPMDVDPEMEKFQSLLQDYLKIDTTTPTPPPAAEPKEDDYVWDVFYSRPSAGTFQELYEPDANIATLTGLPTSTSDALSSDSESDQGDEDDEDSNAEDFYANDYPEEEPSDGSEGSDIFHEDAEDIAGYTTFDDDGDRAWR